MTDNEIIKALEWHYKEVEKGYSDHLAYGGKGDEHEEKYIYMLKDVLDLIKRQQAELEMLKKENNQFVEIGKLYSEIKAEAIKEFAEKMKGVIPEIDDTYIERIVEDYIDNLVKEMVGEAE